ncbi:Penicillin amidase [Acidisarcina polymorpha]|uniref:Penicillin amidase n=1 Tax=Acidisarcina polymorpha TaxID=2211140 RepID=A0A2Z5FSF9_9BACT|nr:penicillin acylase family protein [Acidisarcina polymorpha]AXC09743.1 Penicillin amidase [Acidisarcina polymorpha]
MSGSVRRSPWLRLLGWLLLALVIIVISAVAGGALWLKHAMRASLPQIDGTTKLAGLTAEVSVRRDEHGVPHIEAANLDDLFAAQGYVTAQDRLWQMDMTRRYVAGEIAEVLGKNLVAHDRVQRLLEMRPMAERITAGLSARDRRFFDDYARGVNAFIAAHPDTLPAEFGFLRYKPKLWQPVDSVLVLLGMVQMEDERWESKLEHEQVVAKLGPTLAADLFPVGSWRDHPPTQALPDLTAPQPPIPDVPLDESQSSVEDLLGLRDLLGHSGCDGCAVGSNEWAISGAHTASGKPLMSNDMHITHTIPDIWYEVDLKAGGFHVAGVGSPGSPFVTSGHNDHISWGFTSLYGDTQDIYIERVNNRDEYMSATGWKPIEHIRETIRVRGGNDIVVDVGHTDHGPILTPAIAHEQRVLTLKWSAYDPGANSIPLFDIDAASNWGEFRSILKSWWGPSLNVIYADDQGHIGYQAVGFIPMREGGLSSIPVASGTHEWQGFVPFEQLPSVLDPANGILATANARITPDGYPYPLTLEWAAPYRNERIWKWLAGKNKLTPADMLTLQTDIYSSLDQDLARRYAYAIDHTPKASPQLRQAADLLRSWDGVINANSAPAAVIAAARQAFWPSLLQPKLGDGWKLYSWGEKYFAEEELLTHTPAHWLPSGFANWNEFQTAVVKKGLEDEHAPANLSRWQYGEIRKIELAHPIYGMLPWFKKWTGTGVQPRYGDPTTVDQMGASLGPSQRLTVDWSNLDGSTENIVYGQSGDPLSAWYSDQWPYWYGRTTFTLPFSEQAITAAAKHTLRLTP